MIDQKNKVINYYTKVPKTEVYNPNKGKTHDIAIPSYSLVIGGSGSGKSNLVLDLLHRMSGTFNKIVICLKNKDEPLYEYLEKKSPQIEFIECHEPDDIPDLDSFDKTDNNLIIFDDLVLDKSLQNKISQYYIRARKLNVSCIYISQIYFSIPKKIRVNARYIFLKKLSSVKDLKLILSEYNMSDNLNEIIKAYKDSTAVFENFLLIDTVTNKFTKNYG